MMRATPRHDVDPRVATRLRFAHGAPGWLVAAACVTGCVQPPAPGSTESEIRGGTADSVDPAVVALSVLGVYSYCTATLIAPHTLLTAGHCNQDGMEADFGTNADSPSKSIEIADVKVHPMYGGEGKPFDVAVMKLKSDPQGITPLSLNGTPITIDQVGHMIRHVGYGVTDDSTSEGGGIKRTVSYPLNRLDGMLMYSGAQGEQTCTGDSGGPGLMTLAGQSGETIVSVVSDGPDCQLSQDGWDDRVDAVLDWIVQTTSTWDAPPTVVKATDPGSGSGSGDGTGDPGGGPSPPDSGGGLGHRGDGSGDMGGGCSVGGDAGVAPWLLVAGLLELRRARARARTLARRGSLLR